MLDKLRKNLIMFDINFRPKCHKKQFEECGLRVDPSVSIRNDSLDADRWSYR